MQASAGPPPKKPLPDPLSVGHGMPCATMASAENSEMQAAMVSPSYRIVAYDQRSPALFDEEKALIVTTLAIEPRCVAHIGSTAVIGLAGKPIIDIMVGLQTMEKAPRNAERLETIGYEWRGETVPGTLYIRKADPRRYNVHMTEYEGGFWEEHLLFRDYLRAHADAAQRYEELKRELMAKLASDPPGYNVGKEPFIKCILARASS